LLTTAVTHVFRTEILAQARDSYQRMESSAITCSG